MKEKEEIKVDTKFIFSVSKEDMKKVSTQQFLMEKEKEKENHEMQKM